MRRGEDMCRSTQLATMNGDYCPYMIAQQSFFDAAGEGSMGRATGSAPGEP